MALRLWAELNLRNVASLGSQVAGDMGQTGGDVANPADNAVVDPIVDGVAILRDYVGQMIGDGLRRAMA